MGPRSFKRGNTRAWREMPDLMLALQWGHALLSVETAHLLILIFRQAPLQWGHALLSVETSLD